MNYKRLEIYVGWTCNQKCTYCIEYETMEKAWSKKVSKYDILKKLIKYKMLGYNHVTYLGGEPFIQPVFLDALKLGKKLGYTILVTTNATTLHIDSQAKKFLPYIDELFLSVEALGIEEQQKISRTSNYVQWAGVFENIKKYWNGKTLKANIVITQDNINNLSELVSYLHTHQVTDISITYPDINYGYYGKDYIIEKIAPTYSECIKKIIPIVEYAYNNHIRLKLADFPFCVFPEKNRELLVQLTDDFDFSTRLKIDYEENELDRGDLKDFRKIPRKRRQVHQCKNCKYKDSCWGVSYVYKLLYGLDEINTIYE